MEHKFVASQLNMMVCTVCKRNALAHTDLAICESCNKTGRCDLKNDILMCPDCFSKELEAINNKPVIDRAEEHNKIIEETKSDSAKLFDLSKSITTDLPPNASRFYNAKVAKIVDIEKAINDNPEIPKEKKAFELARIVMERQEFSTKALIVVKDRTLEYETELHVGYQVINRLAQQLQASEREALNIKYNEYKPVKAPVKVTRPRLSAEDKLIVDIARNIFAPKNAEGKISWEERTEEERQADIQKAKQYYNQMFKKK